MRDVQMISILEFCHMQLLFLMPAFRFVFGGVWVCDLQGSF